MNVNLDGDYGVRFLGIDTAEVSLMLPGSSNFTSIKDPAWDTFLNNPFAQQYGNFSSIELDGVTTVQGTAEAILGNELTNYLHSKVGPKCAANHATHADKAKERLIQLIKTDVDERSQQGKPYRYFVAFSFTLVDRYGRLLTFVHRDETRQERRPSYNERMLEEGYATP